VAANLVDDPTIADESLLLRRIPVLQSHIIWDDNERRWRPSSQSFKNHKDNPLAMSVNLQQVLDELGLQPGTVIDPAKQALASIPASFARGHNQKINRLPEPNDPSHAHLLGDKPKPVQEAFAKAAEWVVPPPGWPWPDKA
jgi:hypothetical protein